MQFTRLRVSTSILAGLTLVGILTDSPARAQFGFSVVTDPTQEAHSLKQLVNDIQKLQKLDAQIQQLTAQYNQLVASAKYFSLKQQWKGFGNQIVRNWAPNSYGATPMWNTAVLFGPNAPQAWQNVTVAMRHNQYMNGMLPGSNRQYAYAATVDTFDGAGPAALTTLGNARSQQTQMAQAIANLQASATDGSAGTNSEVEQLNLLTSGAVQNLEMQQTSNNVLTSLLEQQTIANKIQRDALADHLNYETLRDQYLVSGRPTVGHCVPSDYFRSLAITPEEFMLSAIQTKLLVIAIALLASIASYFAYQKHQQEAEQAKVNNLMQHLRPDEKKALDATTNWGNAIQKQHLK